ncbi:MAG: sensor histidine kinase [Piscinibacter sp.]|nr:sensor histidine kinase [Piscinibacter sp.]
MSAPRRWWPFGGSLVGRLVLAQMGMALLLWLAACAYLIWDTARYDEIFEPRLMGPRADMILNVVDALADQPQRLAEALEKIDRFQRRENEEADDPALRMAMNVWSGSRLLYRTPGEPGAVHTEKLRQLERLDIDGKPWRTYSQASAKSDARVTLIRSGHVPSILFAIGGRGILVMPLLVSLPFLILPAWLSVRLALRPWRRFSREIESRGPDDLAPLQFGSRYRELRPVSRAVNLLLERVRAGMARERSFIADAAHELRTPLAAMRVNVEALQAHGAAPRDRELIDGLLRSGERAQRLVAQLLGLMRSDAGSAAAPRAEVDLGALVQDRLAELSPLADRRGVELELLAPPACAVHGEREGLVSLIDNLVENAIKYAPAGSTVTVALARDDADVTLTVEDAGPGIPPALHERVFDRFYRAADQAQPGSGLGLAIVKAVAVRHQARVALGPGTGGQGLRVTVSLPAC